MCQRTSQIAVTRNMLQDVFKRVRKCLSHKYPKGANAEGTLAAVENEIVARTVADCGGLVYRCPTTGEPIMVDDAKDDKVFCLCGVANPKESELGRVVEARDHTHFTRSLERI